MTGANRHTEPHLFKLRFISHCEEDIIMHHTYPCA